MTHVNRMLYNMYNLFMSRPLLVSSPTDEWTTHTTCCITCCMFLQLYLDEMPRVNGENSDRNSAFHVVYVCCNEKVFS